MAEQDRKPTKVVPEKRLEEGHPARKVSTRQLLPIGLGLMLFLVGCFWWGNRPESETTLEEIPALPTVTPSTGQSTASNRSPQAVAALTRVAESLAQSSLPTPTSTAVVADDELVQLPTVTPTVVPSPVATRTVEIGGEATLRLELDSDSFESDGQPVTIEIAPHTFVLGGDTMQQADKWCVQVGPTGLIFDLALTLQPVTENLHVGGELQLVDGFCGEWGSLGKELTTVPMNVIVPVGTSAQLAPTMQVQGSLLGLDNLLNISTGVFLDLTIRNPRPQAP
jgi:hypothetical protein